MRNKLIKLIVSVLIITLLFVCFQGLAYAIDAIDPNDYKPNIGQSNTERTKEMANKILGLISSIGAVCSVIVIAIIGIKYMLGSVEEKADYKKKMTTYMVGAVLLFSSTTLPNIIYQNTAPVSNSEKPFQTYQKEYTTIYCDNALCMALPKQITAEADKLSIGILKSVEAYLVNPLLKGDKDLYEEVKEFKDLHSHELCVENLKESPSTETFCRWCGKKLGGIELTEKKCNECNDWL